MDFPHVINGVAEKDLTTKIFACMAHFDIKTLLACREASKGWRDGIDLYTSLWDRTSLKMAAWHNRIDICRTIVAYAKDKNPKDEEGLTALHVAAAKGYLDIYRLIIDRVDDPNPADQCGRTPLELAQLSGHQEVCQHIKNAISGELVLYGTHSLSQRFLTPPSSLNAFCTLF